MANDFLDLEDGVSVKFNYEWQPAESENNVSRGWSITITEIHYVHELFEANITDSIPHSKRGAIEEKIESYLDSIN